MSLSRTFAFALLCVLVPAAAQEQKLSLRELVSEALERNPEILAAQKRYEAARQRPRVEGALPDPMVGVGWNSSGGPLPFQGVGKEPVANVGFMVTQEFPYPGKRGLRERMFAKEAEAEWELYQSTQLSVMSRLKQAYFRLQHTWSMLDLFARNRELLQRLLKIAEIRYSVGKAMQLDVLKAQSQLSLIETRALQFERERRAREAELNSLLARRLDAPMARTEDPHAVPLTIAVEELYSAAAENSPMLRRDEKMIQRNELAVNMARKEYLPDFALTGGYYYMGEMPNMYMFRADVNIPLYWFRKQRPAVTAEVQSLAQSKRSYEASSRGLQYRIKDDYLMAQTSMDLMNLYSKTVIPQANLTFESSLSAYETGANGFNEVLMNGMATVEYEMSYHEEMMNFHLALARLEEMTGRELIHGGGK
jgi:outer membrane protein TolC